MPQGLLVCERGSTLVAEGRDGCGLSSESWPAWLPAIRLRASRAEKKSICTSSGPRVCEDAEQACSETLLNSYICGS